MIHFHVTPEEMRLISEGLNRLRSNCETSMSGPHMTPVAKDMLRNHQIRIDALLFRVDTRIAQPPRPLAKSPRKRGNQQKSKLLAAVEEGFQG
jgi:hypothetical protein